jgi:hypothetical protein
MLRRIAACEDELITVFKPIPALVNPHKQTGVPEPEFYTDRFLYDCCRDIYVCPVGNELAFWKHLYKAYPERGRLYRTACCAICACRVSVLD